MKKGLFSTQKRIYPLIIIAFMLLSTWGLCFGSGEAAATYEKWSGVGKLAGDSALNLIKKGGASIQKENLIALTNAGYAEVNGESTQGALDGLADATGVSRGRSTLLEIHSALWNPLWFALYDKGSGLCAYIEIDPDAAVKMSAAPQTAAGLFRRTTTEKVEAGHLYANASEYKAKLESGIFGGNEFRIITIANAVASGAPTDAVRAFEFHDHYCPGVTSGILIASYLKKHFPPAGGSYFVHSVQPWCKEDALLVLLNATPGKRSYAVSYPSKADKEQWIAEAKNACTIIYRKNKQTQNWEGIVLAFKWAKTSCPQTGCAIIDKLCADLWYLKYLDKPEDFITAVKQFELPQGVSPADWARPGVDPMQMLGLVKK